MSASSHISISYRKACVKSGVYVCRLIRWSLREPYVICMIAFIISTSAAPKKTLSIPTWTCPPSWPIAQVVGVITRKSQAHTQTHTQTVGESQVCVWLRRKARGRRQSSSGQVRFHRQTNQIWIPPQRGSVMIAVSVLPAIADAFPVETTHLRPKGPFLPILLNDMGTAARRSRKAGYRRGPY